jgi:alpha-tubulin suppressor-like RCC1 family protein
VFCWGRNDFGQVDVPSGRYRDVTVGLAHTCAATQDRELTCWGRNDDGQLDVPDAFRAR